MVMNYELSLLRQFPSALPVLTHCLACSPKAVLSAAGSCFHTLPAQRQKADGHS